MTTLQRIAVVTGSNKGIGYEIVRDLCKRFEGLVYLTARSEDRGRRALESLTKEGFEGQVRLHQLDVADEASITRFADHLKRTHGGLDILVNNAGICVDEQADVSLEEVSEIIRVNYTGTIRMSLAMLPLLRTNARLVNMASRLGMLRLIPNESLRARFVACSSSATSPQCIDELIDDYLKARQNGDDERLGYPTVSQGHYSPAYTMSKIGVIAVTRVLQRIIDAEASTSSRGIVVSVMSPGYCSTDMTNNEGDRTAAEGARTAVFLSLLPADFDGAKGAFWADEKELDWQAPS